MNYSPWRGTKAIRRLFADATSAPWNQAANRRSRA